MTFTEAMISRLELSGDDGTAGDHCATQPPAQVRQRYLLDREESQATPQSRIIIAHSGMGETGEFDVRQPANISLVRLSHL